MPPPPRGGTLKTHWVTPSTFWMPVLTRAGAIVVGALLISGAIGKVTTISLIGTLVCLLFAVGAGAVAVIGFAHQRVRPRLTAR